MISYKKLLFLGVLLCTGFSGISAYPSHAADVRDAVNQKVDEVIDTLNLREWRDVNLVVSLVSGVSILAAIANNDAADMLLVTLGLFMYNMYRGVQRTYVIKNLENIKKIVHNHYYFIYMGMFANINNNTAAKESLCQRTCFFH